MSNVTDAKPRPSVLLFTDGACIQNPGPGGWAYILKHPASGRCKEASGAEQATTNNRMEMMAVIMGLEALKGPSEVALFSDSDYVVKGITERLAIYKACGWRRSAASKKMIKNADLWQRLYGLTQTHRVVATWLRGHAGHPENERCDRMAEAAARTLPVLSVPAWHASEGALLAGTDDEK